jgi:hypothetical protein
MHVARRVTVGAFVVAATLAPGTLVYAVWPPDVDYIESSYDIDVGDQAKVAGFSDHVVVASVVSVGESVDPKTAPSFTTYTIQIETVLKGSLKSGSTLPVTQTGVDLSGKQITQLADITPVREGSRYVLALKTQRDQSLRIDSVPVFSPQFVSDGSDRSSSDVKVITDWKDAIAHQVVPSNLPR